MAQLTFVVFGLLALMVAVVALVSAARRRGAKHAQTVAQNRELAATIARLQKRVEIDREITSTDDSRLADLARSVLHRQGKP